MITPEIEELIGYADESYAAAKLLIDKGFRQRGCQTEIHAHENSRN